MLSATCKYGIRAVIFIASKPERNANTGLKEISEKLDIPQPYLAKILQTLAKKKILHSSKGPHGGFYLMIPAEKLTLMDIIEAFDGRDFFDNCYVTGERCNLEETSDKGVCVLHNELRQEKNRLEKFFESKSIEQLVEQLRSNQSVNI